MNKDGWANEEVTVAARAPSTGLAARLPEGSHAGIYPRESKPSSWGFEPDVTRTWRRTGAPFASAPVAGARSVDGADSA